MDKKQVFVHAFCGVIMVGTWVLCFLPTVFYFNPVKLPEEEQEKERSLNASQTTFPLPSFPCNAPLIFHNGSGFCKPPCDWLPFTEEEQDAFALADWITAIFCTTSFVLVFATWLKIPEFMKFPHIIILLLVGAGTLLELVVLIPKFSKRSTFFCSSALMDEAVNTPTAFCQVQGALIHYVSLAVGGWFVVYNAMLLKNLVFDKLPSLEGHQKLLIISSLICFSLPLTPVIYVLNSDENYVQMYFRVCFPGSNQLAFYSCILPQQIFLSVGTTCLLIVIFKLIKERKSSLIGTPSQAHTRKSKLQRVAVHFIMVIICYVVCIYLTYGLICVQLSNSQAFEKTLKQYFKCLIFTQDCPKDFLKYQTSYGLLILSFLGGNVFQGGTLVLLAGKRKARSLWRSWLLCFAPKCCTFKGNPVQASKRSNEGKKQPGDTSAV